MLSLAKLYAGQQAYYEDAVARGLEDYYLGIGEAPGRWVGRGAESLRLCDVVDAEGLDKILDGRDPITGTRLTEEAPPRVIGYDATFCAPKSVSLLFALGSPEVAAEVVEAHDAAVGAALKVYEDFACRARRGHAGATVLEADGFVGAAFRHRSSRAGDPHLHTHVLIAFPVHAQADGRWSALDGRQAFPWSKPVGHLYEAQLRAELTRRLGVEWGPVRNGIADIAAVPTALRRVFSQRRAEIEAHLEERGQSSARAAQVATYATRQPKDRSMVGEDLFAASRERARALGVTEKTVAGWTRPGRAIEVIRPVDTWVSSLFEHMVGPDGLTARRSTFHRRAVVQAVADSFGHVGDVATVVSLADAFLGSCHVVHLPVATPSGHMLHTRDGTVRPLEADKARFTTPELLAIEGRVIAEAKARVSEGVALVPRSLLELALRRHPHLSAEQRALVSTLTRSGRGVDVIVGAAGTGKTAALDAARAAWESAGHAVIGCALAARAAAELRKASGIESSTIDRLLASARRTGRLPGAKTLVVDEAGMVGTRQLARVLDLAAQAGAKVVLVGDHRQLPEIAAGGAFAGLSEALGAVTLRQNRRQSEKWEREALRSLRDGDPQQAVDRYIAAGRVRVGTDSRVMHGQMVDDWWVAREDGQDVLMLASRRAQVEALNRLARARLHAAGRLGAEELSAGGRSFAVGEAVIAGRNDSASACSTEAAGQ